MKEALLRGDTKAQFTATKTFVAAAGRALELHKSFDIDNDAAMSEEITQELSDISKQLQGENIASTYRDLAVNHTNRHRIALDKKVATALLGLSQQGAGLTIRRAIAEVLTKEVKFYGEYAEAVPPQVVFEGWDLDKELEPWQGKSMDELWTVLGLRETKHIVGMAKYRDPELEYNSWKTTQFTHWWDDPAIPAERKSPLEPNYHQLVGVIKCVQWLTSGRGGLIADEVGVGKTGQVIMSLLMYFQLLQAQQANIPLPPLLGECRYVSRPTRPRCADTAGGRAHALARVSARNAHAENPLGIPPTTTLSPDPIIIVLPPSLVVQWENEFRRWCEKGTVNIMPYTGKFNARGRKSFWAAADSASKDQGRVVILTTLTVSTNTHGQC